MFISGNYEKEKAILSENLRRERKRLHITQTELALRVGTEKSAISRYENGAQEPGLDMLRRLAEALETTADALLREKPPEAGSLDDMLLSLPEEQRALIQTTVIAMVHGLKSREADIRL